MTTGTHSAAWNAFWRGSAAPAGKPGCLPAGGGLAEVLSSVWRQFAQSLPARARVLDIGTGDGRVMGWMLAERSDLQLEGIDLAPELPPPPADTRSRGGVAMEQLPAAAGAFDAIVGQFAFEYGDLAAAAAEFARVLTGDGVIGLVTHHRDGPIYAQNVRRRQGIEWALFEAKLPSMARRALDRCAPGQLYPPAPIRDAPQRGAELFGARSAAWEIAEAIRLTLARGQAGPANEVAAAIREIEERAMGEIGRLNALEAACAQIADDTALSVALNAAGLRQRERHPLNDGRGTSAFADFRLIGRLD
ncbi:class I SAM-dependent methyltransferase [Parafrankia sp. BMG5.11]|uniref:methyltransferase domain-containing protein n=1 Tax=Parafrankia sp. BMG5.11 TaxID=222540 RepID=UPI0014048F51|nr:class I SAM-dependent methyltransferase [Parafrankia sp. BMG5.11]